MGRIRKDGGRDRRYKDNNGSSGCAGILILPIGIIATLIYFLI